MVERAPFHRPIDADDVGAAADYLLSDDARDVTGTALYADADSGNPRDGHIAAVGTHAGLFRRAAPPR